MDSKKVISVGALVAIAIGVAVAFGMFAKAPEETPGELTPQMLTYTSSEYEVSFEYPDTYRVEERTDGFENQTIKVVTLIDKDAVIPDMSEGPPVISMIVVPNPENTPLEQWVRTKSISNFNLSIDGRLASTTIAGEPTLAYQYSGLYENDAVAIAHDGKVYLFSASWLTSEDTIRQDFMRVLESIRFL